MPADHEQVCRLAQLRVKSVCYYILMNSLSCHCTFICSAIITKMCKQKLLMKNVGI